MRAFHVAGTAAVENVVPHLATEGIRLPVRIADRDNVGMARKADMRRSGANAREQIVDLPIPQRCDGKAKPCQSVGECGLRASIGRCDRGAADQRLGKGQRIVQFLHGEPSPSPAQRQEDWKGGLPNKGPYINRAATR